MVIVPSPPATFRPSAAAEFWLRSAPVLLDLWRHSRLGCLAGTVLDGPLPILTGLLSALRRHLPRWLVQGALWIMPLLPFTLCLPKVLFCVFLIRTIIWSYGRLMIELGCLSPGLDPMRHHLDRYESHQVPPFRSGHGRLSSSRRRRLVAHPVSPLLPIDFAVPTNLLPE